MYKLSVFLSELRARCLTLFQLFFFFFHYYFFNSLFTANFVKVPASETKSKQKNKKEKKQKHILNSRKDKAHRYRPVYIINSSSTITYTHHNLCILIELSFYTIGSANHHRVSSIHCIKQSDKTRQMQ